MCKRLFVRCFSSTESGSSKKAFTASRFQALTPLVPGICRGSAERRRITFSRFVIEKTYDARVSRLRRFSRHKDVE